MNQHNNKPHGASDDLDCDKPSRENAANSNPNCSREAIKAVIAEVKDEYIRAELCMLKPKAPQTGNPMAQVLSGCAADVEIIRQNSDETIHAVLTGSYINRRTPEVDADREATQGFSLAADTGDDDDDEFDLKLLDEMVDRSTSHSERMLLLDCSNWPPDKRLVDVTVSSDDSEPLAVITVRRSGENSFELRYDAGDSQSLTISSAVITLRLAAVKGAINE